MTIVTLLYVVISLTLFRKAVRCIFNKVLKPVLSIKLISVKSINTIVSLSFINGMLTSILYKLINSLCVLDLYLVDFFPIEFKFFKLIPKLFLNPKCIKNLEVVNTRNELSESEKQAKEAEKQAITISAEAAQAVQNIIKDKKMDGKLYYYHVQS